MDVMEYNSVKIKKMLDGIKGKKLLILGFGREGRSSLHLLRKFLPDADFAVADANTALASELSDLLPKDRIFLGPDYLQAVPRFEVVLQSPGICLKDCMPLFEKVRLTSQTELFLEAYRDQCIAVTGTKGKSTTSSLIAHLLKETGHEVVFGGNIGLPLFELLSQITPQTHIVLELSCHQLEFVNVSPHVAVLLNLFEEHLDHYRSYEAYQEAKYQIARHQHSEDVFICSGEDERIARLMEKFPPRAHLQTFSSGNLPSVLRTENFPLPGEHNRLNAMAALLAVQAMEPSVKPEQWQSALNSFRSLPHRMEYVGEVKGIRFFNDSISTIPQAAVAAVNALKDVETLILGGMDRGIDYTPLIPLFASSSVRHFLFTGAAGKRMMGLANPSDGRTFAFFEQYEDIVEEAFRRTSPGKICLLSPAAPSYDAFRNFEERGEVFRKLVLNRKSSKK